MKGANDWPKPCEIYGLTRIEIAPSNVPFQNNKAATHHPHKRAHPSQTQVKRHSTRHHRLSFSLPAFLLLASLYF